jgi:hypothetical protein
MKPTIFLRIAAVLTFIHALLHTIGGVFGKIPLGPASIGVGAIRGFFGGSYDQHGDNRVNWFALLDSFPSGRHDSRRCRRPLSREKLHKA